MEGGLGPPAPCSSQPHTYLLSARSVLLPTSMMITSLPLSVLTSSIHLEVCWKELRSGSGKWGDNRVRVSLSRQRAKVGGSMRPGAGGRGLCILTPRPVSPGPLAGAGREHVCLWSCCPGPWRDPYVAEPPPGWGAVTPLEDHCHELLHGPVVLEAHLRIRPDFGGSEQSVKMGALDLAELGNVCVCVGGKAEQLRGEEGPTRRPPTEGVALGKGQSFQKEPSGSARKRRRNVAPGEATATRGNAISGQPLLSQKL